MHACRQGFAASPCQHASGEREIVNRAEKKTRRRFDVRDPDFMAGFESTERGKKAGGVQVLVWGRKQQQHKLRGRRLLFKIRASEVRRAASGPAWRRISLFVRATLQILKGGNVQNRLYLTSHERLEWAD